MSDLKKLVADVKLHLEQQGWNKDWCEIDGVSGDLLESFIAVFDKYSLNITEYFNGYAQAQADGVGKPLADDKDIQCVIDMQKGRIKELIETLKYVGGQETGYSPDARFDRCVNLARHTLKSLGIEGEG